MLTYPRTDSRALPEDYVAVGQEDHRDDRRAKTCPARCARWRRMRSKALEGRLRQAEQARLRQRQGVGPLRHHPDAAGAEEPDRDRGQALRHGGQALPRGVLPAGRVHGHDAHHHGEGAAARSTSFQTNGKVLVKPGWLAVYGKEAQEDDANLVPVAAGRDGAHRERRRQRAEDQAAGALHRGHAAAARWKARAS